MLPLRNDAIKKWQWPGFPLQVVYFVSIKGESFAGGSIVEERCDFDVVGSVRRFGFRRTPTSVTPYSTTTEDASLLPSQMLEWFAAMQPDKSILGALGVQPWLDVNEGLNGVATYNFVPSIMREHQSVNHGLMDYAGSNLPTVLLQLKEIDSETVERVRMYLSTIVPGVKSFTHVKYGDRETLQFLIEAAGKELVLDASSMSDGTLRVFASLMAAFQIGLPTGPTLVAIEEPETSLHPAAMHALVDALDEATSRTQILLTTHSTELLDTPTIQPKNVRVVEMVDGETVITGVDNATLKIVRDGLNTLGGLERNNLLELNHEQLERQKREAAAPAKGGTA